MFDYSRLNMLFYFCTLTYIPVIFMLKFYIDRLDIYTKTYLCIALQMPWTFWCTCLSIFSMFGTYYTGKYLLYGGLLDEKNIMGTDAEFWYHAFIISKIPELLDTIFIVLRSKKLVMLQYYHHLATLMISFYGAKFMCSKFTIFMFMNYFVHMFMYFYYAMYPFFKKQMRKFGTFVNILQVLQMLFAIVIIIYYYVSSTDLICIVYPTSEQRIFVVNIGVGMYISYFVLFIALFFERIERITPPLRRLREHKIE